MVWRQKAGQFPNLHSFRFFTSCFFFKSLDCVWKIMCWCNCKDKDASHTHITAPSTRVWTTVISQLCCMLLRWLCSHCNGNATGLEWRQAQTTSFSDLCSLVSPTSKCDCRVHTCPKEPYFRVEHSLFRNNCSKQTRWEKTFHTVLQCGLKCPLELFPLFYSWSQWLWE